VKDALAALGIVAVAFYFVMGLAFLMVLCENEVPFRRALWFSVVWPYTLWRVTR
jgi:hypothetical protein